MKFTTIGTVSHDYGQDVYMLVKLEDEDFHNTGWSPSFEVQERMVTVALQTRYYHESRGAGTYYCTEFEVIRKPCTDEFIALAKVRYDV